MVFALPTFPHLRHLPSRPSPTPAPTHHHLYLPVKPFPAHFPSSSSYFRPLFVFFFVFRLFPLFSFSSFFVFFLVFRLFPLFSFSSFFVLFVVFVVVLVSSFARTCVWCSLGGKLRAVIILVFFEWS